MKIKLKLVLISIVIAGIIFLKGNLSVEAMENKRVLILNSYDIGLQWTRDINSGIDSILKKEKNLEIQYEFMDTKNYSMEEYMKFFYDTYKIKYKEVKFDLVICSDNDALDFMLKYGKEIFKDPPVIFCGINNYDEYNLPNNKNITGVVEEIDIKSTIQSIFQIQPNTKDIVVICDSSTTGKINEADARAVSEEFKDRVNFHFYRDISVDKLKENAEKLGKDTVLLNVAQLRNNEGKFIPYEKTGAALKGFDLPIYTCWDFLVGDKFIGGKVIGGYSPGETAAKLALKILKGHKASNLPVVTKCPSRYVFNYNELHKYVTNLDNLPKDYLIINEPFSFYKEYKKIIWHVILVISALVFFIIILMFNIKTRVLSERKLMENYEELTAVHEELAATEEELRAQYEELQEREQEVNNIQERYKLAVDGANDVIWEWDMVKNEFFFSDKWENVTGYSMDTKEPIVDILKKVVLYEDLEAVFTKVQEHINGYFPYFHIEFRINKISGERRWIYTRGKVLRDKRGNAIKMAGSITDITNIKDVQERNQFLSYYDELTSLPNRSFGIEILKRKVNEAKIYNEKGAAIYFDIDNFKNINDTLGHNYGDELLKEVGKRIQGILNDEETICRIGGDEFLIIQWGISDINTVKNFAEEIIKCFEEPFKIKDKKVFTTVSIGISVFPDDGITEESIFKNVDTAMNKAKDSGKNRYLFYDSNMHSELMRKSELEKRLRKAIDNGELKLVFQPQVELNEEKIVASEVLLRWISDEFGFVSPEEFIPLAEETGLIIPIGKWVLEQACLINKQWMDEGYAPKIVGVNVSVIQLKDENFLENLREILHETNLQPKYLELEITESVVMEDLDETLKILNEIRFMGVNISLDDFGTGYSSLSYLKELPINKLKIDKSFIDKIQHDESSKEIVDGIIQLAHKIELTVLAEGVETKEQLDILKNMNCDKIQGYYFSKPISKEEFEKMC